MTLYSTTEAYFSGFYEELCKLYTPTYTGDYIQVLCGWTNNKTPELEKLDVWLHHQRSEWNLPSPFPEWLYEFLYVVLYMDFQGSFDTDLYESLLTQLLRKI